MIISLLIASMTAIVPPAPLAEALSWSSSPQAVHFTLAVSAAEYDIRARIEVNANADSRITILSPTEAEPVRSAVSVLREELTDESDGRIWCDQLGRMLPQQLTVEMSSPDRIRYRFRPRAADGSDSQERRMLAASTAALTIARNAINGKWSVAEFELSLTRAFRPIMLARIDSLDLRVQCEASLSTAGRSYQRHITTALSGSAMGMAFSETHAVEISDVALGVSD